MLGRPTIPLLLLPSLLLLLSPAPASSCLCHVVPHFACPPPPHCCESGMYTFDECGCCMTCAKAELQECGGPSGDKGNCAQGLQCLKTCGEKTFHVLNECTREF